jgi:hypothetical protein
MSSHYKIAKVVLQHMHNFLDNEKKHIGRVAPVEDMFFMADGAWLKDSSVIAEISSRKGAWEVNLIFAHHKNPLLLIIRNITRCFSEQKALATAFYIRKEAAKDRRGTLNVSLEDLTLCTN